MTIKIAVLTPYFGGMDYEHRRCMDELGKLPKSEDAEIHFVQISNWPWIDIAQSFLVDKTLKELPDTDIMFWIEHDMIFNPLDVPKLSRHCLDSEFDMLGAAYSQRTPGGKIVGSLKEENVEFFVPGLHAANSCGFGFTATKPSLYKSLRELLPRVPCPAFEKHMAKEDSYTWPYFGHLTHPEYYGQDTSFCLRVLGAGKKIGIDAEFRVGHKGTYTYQIEDTGITVPRYERLVVQKPVD